MEQGRFGEIHSFEKTNQGKYRLEKIQVENVDEKTGNKTTKTLAQHIFVEQMALKRLRKINKKDEPAKDNKKRKRPIEETHVVTLELDD